MEDAPHERRRVEPSELRRLFRESGLQERYERGELTE